MIERGPPEKIHCNSASFSGEKKYIEAFQSVYFLTIRKKFLTCSYSRRSVREHSRTSLFFYAKKPQIKFRTHSCSCPLI